MEIQVYVAYQGGSMPVWMGLEKPTRGELSGLAAAEGWGSQEIVVKEYDVDLWPAVNYQHIMGEGTVVLIVPEDDPPF